jgi:sugar phosphate isomerase/epimerase
MKLSVLMNLYHDKTLDEVLARMSELGIKTVEVGAG